MIIFFLSLALHSHVPVDEALVQALPQVVGLEGGVVLGVEHVVAPALERLGEVGLGVLRGQEEGLRLLLSC